MSAPYDARLSQPATIGMIALAAIAITIIVMGKDTALITPIIAAIPTLAGIDRYLHVRDNDVRRTATPPAV